MITYVPKMKPFLHQSTALETGWDLPGFAFFMEMGCGKTKVTIDNMCMLRENRGLNRMLVLAPKGVYANWPQKELPEHLPDRHALSTTVHLYRGGGTVTEKRQLEALMAPGDDLRILVVNTEAVSASTKAYELCERFIRSGETLFVVDEASTMKNPTATRTKRAIKLAALARWRRILTGTPNPRSPLDLWSQFEILGRATLGFKSFFAFRSRFAIMQAKDFGGRSVDVVVGYRNTELLSQLVKPHAIIVRKEDALDLPPKIYTVRGVELTAEQKRMYEELKQFATTQISDEEHLTATHVMTQILRLHQLVCGYAQSESGSLLKVPNNRISVLNDVLEEAGGKTIIWCNYRQDIDDIYADLTSKGYRVVRYDGSTSTEDRKDAVYRFQGEMENRICPEEEQADIFLGTPHAAGYGITLTAASTVVYYSNTYDLEKRLQSEDRAHRIGQTKSVTYVDLVSTGTIDEKIIEALRKKETLANIILDGPARVRNFFS